MDNKSKNRLSELDALRGIAAFSVLMFHYTIMYYNLYPTNAQPLFRFPYGFYGVHLFFIISGFVIFMTLEKTKKPMDFIISRLSRLFPTYWLSILLNVLIFLILGKELNINQVLFNMTMVHKWFGVGHIDGVYWTLGVELFFYGVMLVLFILKGLQYIEVLGLVWLSLMMINVRVGTFLHYTPPAIIDNSLFLSYGHLFLAGIIFYKIYKNGRASVQQGFILFLCLMTQLLVSREYYPSSQIVAFFFFLFFLVVNQKAVWLRNSVLVFLGEISYSLYLVHENFGFFIMDYVYKFTQSPYLAFICPTVASISLAYVVNKLVEKPTMKLIRSLYRRESKIS